MVQLKQIVFTKPYTAEFLNVGEINLSKIEEKSVAVKTVVSTISAGTERANLIGTKLFRSIRRQNLLFREHWDTAVRVRS